MGEDLIKEDVIQEIPEPVAKVEPTPDPPQAPPAVYSAEQFQKAMESVRESAYQAGLSAKEREIQEQAKANAEKAKAEEHAALVSTITADHAAKKWYEDIDPEYANKPPEWIQTLEPVRLKQIEDFKRGNTAAPAGAQTVGKTSSIDSYWDKKDAEKRAKKRGGK